MSNFYGENREILWKPTQKCISSVLASCLYVCTCILAFFFFFPKFSTSYTFSLSHFWNLIPNVTVKEPQNTLELELKSSTWIGYLNLSMGKFSLVREFYWTRRIIQRSPNFCVSHFFNYSLFLWSTSLPLFFWHSAQKYFETFSNFSRVFWFLTIT